MRVTAKLISSEPLDSVQEAAISEQARPGEGAVLRDGDHLGSFRLDASGHVHVEASDEEERSRLEQLIQQFGQPFGGDFRRADIEAARIFFDALRGEGYEFVVAVTEPK